MVFRKPLRWLSGTIYGGIYEHGGEGCKTYLEDLWKEAPVTVALTQTALATIVFFLPVFNVRRPRLFSQLTSSEKEAFQRRLAFSRFYLLQLVAYGLKSHALMAGMRQAKERG